MTKRIPISLFLIAFFALSAGLVFAQRPLEVPLPAIGQDTPIIQTPLLPNYIKYIFNFSIAITGLVSFSVLVYGGLRYLTSAGNPTKMSDANDQIFSALIGLVVILGSWLLLSTVNPQLLILDVGRQQVSLAGIDLPGVFLCKALAGDPAKDCDGPYISDKNTLSSGFDNQARYVRIKNIPGIKYGAILHTNKNLGGDCEIILSTIADPNSTSVITVPISRFPNQISSISVFKQDASVSGTGVTVCENIDCKKVNEGDAKEAKKLFTFEMGSAVPGFDQNIVKGFTDLGNYFYDNGDKIGGVNIIGRYNQGISALEIDRYLTVLFRDASHNGVCEEFNGSDPNLGIDNIIGNDKAGSMLIIKGVK